MKSMTLVKGLNYIQCGDMLSLKTETSQRGNWFIPLYNSYHLNGMAGRLNYSVKFLFNIGLLDFPLFVGFSPLVVFPVFS